MNRRTFLKLGAAGCSAVLLHGCRGSARRGRNPDTGGLVDADPSATDPTAATHCDPDPARRHPDPYPAAGATPPPQTARIALVRATIALTAARAGSPRRGDFQGKRILIKPNYNSAHPAPLDRQRRARPRRPVAARGGERLEVWDRSEWATPAVMQQKGLAGLARDYDWYFAFDDLGSDDWVMVDFAGSHWPHGFRSRGRCSRPTPSSRVPEDAPLGGHFTLSLKNSVGWWQDGRPGGPTDYMAGILHRSPHKD
jgi:hypothetical protein